MKGGYSQQTSTPEWTQARQLGKHFPRLTHNYCSKAMHIVIGNFLHQNMRSLINFMHDMINWDYMYQFSSFVTDGGKLALVSSRRFGNRHRKWI